MPFVTAGYPDLQTTASLLPAIQRAGAVVCEVGIPFSDPIADGPVIQASMSAALEKGVRPQDVWNLVADLRSQLTMGLVAMVSYSIVFRIGVKAFCEQAKAAGIDGFVFPDLPLEEAPPVMDCVAEAGLVCSMLVAPTTPDERAARIARCGSGFVYVLARSGLTGERKTVPVTRARRIERLREVTDLPLAVGFGIAEPSHVAQVTQVADAAIVGSAVVRRITDHAAEGPDAIARQVETFVRDLAQGL